MWKTLNREYVLDSRYMRIRRETVQLLDGTIYNEYYIREFRGWVAIFALTTSGTVLLTRQYKHGIGKIVVELPAGGLDDGESPESAARREFEEETGYIANQIEFLGKFILEPTACDGHVYVFYADNIQRTGKILNDPKEQIEILEVPIDRLKAMLLDGSINVITQLGIIQTILKLKNL